jgi:hypothetical protein
VVAVCVCVAFTRWKLNRAYTLTSRAADSVVCVGLFPPKGKFTQHIHKLNKSKYFSEYCPFPVPVLEHICGAQPRKGIESDGMMSLYRYTFGTTRL